MPKQEDVTAFHDSCIRAVKIITDAHMYEINRLCVEIIELRKLKTAAQEALDFLEANYGNLTGTDWSNEDAAHVADQLNIQLEACKESEHGNA